MEYLPHADHTSDISLKSLASIVWRRKWIFLLIVTASIGTTLWFTRRMTRLYRATAQMNVIERGVPLAANSADASIAPVIETPETQVAMLQSDSMAARTQSWLKNDAYAKGLATDALKLADDPRIWKNFHQWVRVTIPDKTNIVSVEATARDPKRAAALANAVCLAFVDWKKEIAQESSKSITDSLGVRAERAKQQLLQAEQQETLYKQQHRLVDVPAQEKATLERFLARDGDVAALKQEEIAEQAKLKGVSQQLSAVDGSIRNGAGVRDDTLVTSLQTQLNSLEMERAQAALKYTPDYPGVLPDLDAKIADVKSHLAKAIDDTISNKKPSLQSQGALYEEYKQTQLALILTRAKINAATKLRDEYKQETTTLPKTSMEFARLARTSELARSLYTSLQAQLNAVRLNKDMAVANVQLTSWAVEPDAPFQPDKTKNVAVGTTIGFSVAILLALLLETSDQRVRNVQDVRRLVRGPVIGVMPQMPRRQMRDLLESGRTPEAVEAYSMARANLAAALRGDSPHDPFDRQIILVTSAVPGEGKSITAAQLARSLARSGKSVILVDADMRRPAQNRLFGTAEPIGLADLLSEKVSLDEALVASDTTNLSILHSGTPEASPTDLVSLPALPKTLEALREEADVVIVDAPACAVVADALLLAPHVDSVLYVLGAGQVNETLVTESIAALSAAAPKNMVYFINRAPRDTRYSYRSYYTGPRSGWGSSARNGMAVLPAPSDTVRAQSFGDEHDDEA